MYPYTLDCYERAVRSEDTRNDIDILRCYVNVGMQHGQAQTTMQATRHVYWRIANTLEETTCDSLLSFAWRKKAHAFLKRLKPLMYELLSASEYQKFSARIQCYADYFLDTENTIKK